MGVVQRQRVCCICVRNQYPTRHTKSNPNTNSNLTIKQHTLVSIQLNIVTCTMYPENFI